METHVHLSRTSRLLLAEEFHHAVFTSQRQRKTVATLSWPQQGGTAGFCYFCSLHTKEQHMKQLL